MQSLHTAKASKEAIFSYKLNENEDGRKTNMFAFTVVVLCIVFFCVHLTDLQFI